MIYCCSSDVCAMCEKIRLHLFVSLGVELQRLEQAAGGQPHGTYSTTLTAPNEPSL